MNGLFAVKRKYSTETRLFIFFMLISMVLGVAPKSHAQSVQTWSEPVNLSMSGAATNPSLIVDSKGTLHTFWVDQFSGYQYSTSVDGISWSVPKTVKFPFNTKGLPPRWIVDTAGIVHLFWISDKNALLYAQTSDVSIASPSAWRVMATIDSSVYDFDAAVDAKGKIHLSYIKNPKAPSNELSGVYYIQSVNGGAIWQQKELLYESAYFRSVNADSAHVRVAVSNDPENQTVYSVWDDRAQKRVFMGISRNGGQDWEGPTGVVAPDATNGFQTPFGSNINLIKGDVLLTWQVGEPGVRCALYSRTSSDNGGNWDEPIRVLAESAQCPERSEFLSFDPEYSVMMLTVQGELSMIVWNGSAWSNMENQTGPSSITNPATFESVLLRCRQAVPFNNRLFVVGCDQAGGDEAGGDIWFISRELDPLAGLFPLPSAWGLEKNITRVPQRISAMTSVTDAAGGIHAVWVQTAASPAAAYNPRFMYAQWNGTEWSNPAAVIRDLSGVPSHPTLAIDNEQRLLMTWVNENTGDLMFSWANSARANNSLEWSESVILPSPSKLNDAPSIIVDASGRIVVAYAVAVNEDRGIYVTHSTDLGATWLSPQRAFDAVEADWDRVGQPKLAFTEDGVLHLLFSQYTALSDDTGGELYYSQSVDGGGTWTKPEAVSNDAVGWSDMISVPQKGLHRFWQASEKLVVSTFHQISSDGGKTWNSPTKISSFDTLASEPAISADWMGNIHFLQTTVTDLEYLNEWLWTNDQWQLVETKKIAIPTEDSISKVESGITSDGMLYCLLSSEFVKPDEELESKLMSLNRSLNLSTSASPLTATIIEPSGQVTQAEIPDAPSTATVSPLVELEDSPALINRNTVGFILVIVVVAVILVTVVPKRNK